MNTENKFIPKTFYLYTDDFYFKIKANTKAINHAKLMFNQWIKLLILEMKYMQMKKAVRKRLHRAVGHLKVTIKFYTCNSP